MSYVNDETIHILSKIFTQMDGLKTETEAEYQKIKEEQDGKDNN